MTAGKIGKKFIDATRNMPKSKEREQLKDLAQRFMELVETRNQIMHGKPCTSPSGDQRLSGKGIIEISSLEDAADKFVECGSELNGLFYGFLKNYSQNQAPTTND